MHVPQTVPWWRAWRRPTTPPPVHLPKHGTAHRNRRPRHAVGALLPYPAPAPQPPLQFTWVLSQSRASRKNRFPSGTLAPPSPIAPASPASPSASDSMNVRPPPRVVGRIPAPAGGISAQGSPPRPRACHPAASRLRLRGCRRWRRHAHRRIGTPTDAAPTACGGGGGDVQHFVKRHGRQANGPLAATTNAVANRLNPPTGAPQHPPGAPRHTGRPHPVAGRISVIKTGTSRGGGALGAGRRPASHTPRPPLRPPRPTSAVAAKRGAARGHGRSRGRHVGSRRRGVADRRDSPGGGPGWKPNGGDNSDIPPPPTPRGAPDGRAGYMLWAPYCAERLIRWQWDGEHEGEVWPAARRVPRPRPSPVSSRN